ncbi:MAG: glycosyltransferase family 1 protein [Patescibacteria group bacterium]|jgi:glycosyltransferase involved in cell wall biosynthesis
MRIAIDIRPLTAPHKTGVSIVTDALIRHMAAHAPEDEFLLFATGTEETLMNIPQYSQKNVSIITLPIANKLANLFWLLPGGLAMDRFLPNAPDVWLLPNAHIHKTSTPYVVLFHDAAIRTVPECFTLKDHARTWFTNEERTFKNAKTVISVSTHSTQDAIAYYGVQEKNIVTAPLGIDHAIFLPREQSSDRSYRAAYDLNRPYILWLATREPRKNVDSVVRAYSEFRERHKESIPLVLIGADGWKIKHIRSALETSPFRNDIRELFYIPEKHKAALYRGATAFLFPSLYEGFGLPVLEAMACGAPVITSLTSSIPDVTSNAAMLIDPLNVSDLVQALDALFDSVDGENLRTILRARGIAQSELFHWETTAKIVLDALHNNEGI